jgi:hypothetical protein
LVLTPLDDGLLHASDDGVDPWLRRQAGIHVAPRPFAQGAFTLVLPLFLDERLRDRGALRTIDERVTNGRAHQRRTYVLSYCMSWAPCGKPFVTSIHIFFS